MPYSTADIRNVCLVGPSHAGKTLLTEALLLAGGKLSEKGSIEKGTTVSDYTAREKEIGHSQFNSVCHLDHEGIHVNLIDTPGYRDFFGRALSVMPAAETAAIVINATDGVEEMARRMMNAAHDQRMCRMIIVNKIDAEGVNLEKVFNDIQDAFGKECLPMNLPSADGSKVVDCFFQLEGDETAFSSVPE
ncbi:MAG: GTP-binding protein, partial [Gammaproteobacteria bacterium]|nr:GTP-binding protein [Gammaproteobacteria bacterium]